MMANIHLFEQIALKYITINQTKMKLIISSQFTLKPKTI